MVWDSPYGLSRDIPGSSLQLEFLRRYPLQFACEEKARPGVHRDGDTISFQFADLSAGA